MIHILKNSQGQYYWMGVTKKANVFEEIDRDTEFHTRKEKCEENMLIAAALFGSDSYWYVADHTAKDKVWRYFKSGGDKVLFDPAGYKREIAWVKKQKEKSVVVKK